MLASPYLIVHRQWTYFRKLVTSIRKTLLWEVALYNARERRSVFSKEAKLHALWNTFFTLHIFIGLYSTTNSCRYFSVPKWRFWTYLREGISPIHSTVSYRSPNDAESKIYGCRLWSRNLWFGMILADCLFVKQAWERHHAVKCVDALHCMRVSYHLPAEDSPVYKETYLCTIFPKESVSRSLTGKKLLCYLHVCFTVSCVLLVNKYVWLVRLKYVYFFQEKSCSAN